MKTNIIISLTALLLAGCSQSEPSVPDAYTPSGTEIRVACSAPVAVTARAPYDGTYPFTAKVLASTASNNFLPASLIGDGPMTFLSASSSPDYQQYTVGYDNSAVNYPANPDAQVFLKGLYPVLGWTAETSESYSFVFAGKSDITTAVLPTVATTRRDAMAVPTLYKRLEFIHQLTYLELQVVAPTAEIAAKWGDLHNIRLAEVGDRKPARKFVIDLVSGATSFYTDPEREYLLFYTTSDTDFTAQHLPIPVGTPQTVAYVLCQPVDVPYAGSARYTINIETTKRKDPANIPIHISAAGSTAGKHIVVTVTLDAAQSFLGSTSRIEWIDMPQ